jgi:hypothetical protein
VSDGDLIGFITDEVIVMEILLADSLGFCMGVKRAVDLAYRAIEKSMA